MVVQHNITAVNAHRQLANNNSMVSKNLEKLSSGYKINRAGDDAAGLAISEKMRSQIKGLETAQKNSNDGISLIQTAEGALTEVHSMLNRMVELATQSANGTYTDADRNELHKEVNTLRGEIDRISDGTNFNGINLLDGNLGGYTMTGGAELAVNSVSISGGKLDGTDGALFTVADNKLTAIEAGGLDLTATASVSYTMSYTDEKGKTQTLKTDIWASVAAVTLNTVANVSITVTAKADMSDANKAILKDGINFRFNKTEAAAGKAATALSGKSGLNLQVGDTNDDFQKVNVSVKSMSALSLGIDRVDISNETDAGKSIQMINNAINSVSSTRADLGALQNRLEHTINNLGVTTENMSAAESRIRDTDMAKEMMTYTKNNILTQAAQAMLAQANQLPQGVLQLLR